MNARWIMVKVHPHAKKDILLGLGPNRFEAWLRAKPLGGQANDALLALLGSVLQVAPSRLRLVKGHQGRHKLIQVLD